MRCCASVTVYVGFQVSFVVLPLYWQVDNIERFLGPYIHLLSKFFFLHPDSTMPFCILPLLVLLENNSFFRLNAYKLISAQDVRWHSDLNSYVPNFNYLVQTSVLKMWKYLWCLFYHTENGLYLCVFMTFLVLHIPSDYT